MPAHDYRSHTGRARRPAPTENIITHFPIVGAGFHASPWLQITCRAGTGARPYGKHHHAFSNRRGRLPCRPLVSTPHNPIFGRVWNPPLLRHFYVLEYFIYDILRGGLFGLGFVAHQNAVAKNVISYRLNIIRRNVTASF